MQVAKEILKQIQYLTPTPVFWSWGASAFKSLPTDRTIGDINTERGALIFYTRGHHHKGHVLIVLTFMDTYTVYIGHQRKNNFKVKSKFTDVYFDELSDVLDTAIEKIPAYAQ